MSSDWKAEARKWEARAKENGAAARAAELRAAAAEARLAALEAAPQDTPPKCSAGPLAVPFQAPRTSQPSTANERHQP